MITVHGTNYPSDPHIPFEFINKMYLLCHLKQNDIIILHDRKWTTKMLDNFLMKITNLINYSDYYSYYDSN